MMYWHEEQERCQNQAFTNTLWPLMDITVKSQNAMITYLRRRGLNDLLAEENGWYPSRHAGDDDLRIVIPAVSPVQGHAYWQARSVDDVVFRYKSPFGQRHGAIIRVTAFPDSKGERATPFCVVVEGPMDALAAAECGYDSFAIMGITPGKDALTYLAKLIDHRPTLVTLDSEPKATAQSMYLSQWLCTQGIRSKFSTFLQGKDLAAGTKADRQEFLKSAFSLLVSNA